MKLLLFDVDGTLIRSHGAGRMALEAALTELFGTAGPIADYQMSGKTDARIITDLLIAVGIDDKTIDARLPEIYKTMAVKGRDIFWEQEMASCAGIDALLPRLAARNDVLLGLLTGNSSITAPLKLEASGINPLIFRVGAYGSDAIDRNQLPALAMERAHQLTGIPITGEQTVIIGDTPADILCARAGKATAVAVASGWHAVATLAKYQPDHLLENLADTDHVLKILLAND